MREIANRRVELEKQIKEIENRAVPEVTIGQIKNVFLDCNKAADSYLHATDEAKRRTLEKLLSNVIITNKTVAKYSFKSPYQLVANIPKNAIISQLLRVLDDVRTSLISISDLNWFRIVKTW